MKYGFGIDMGGTSVKLALFDLEGNIVEKWSIPTRTEDGASMSCRILPHPFWIAWKRRKSAVRM